jgi:hypothetical protein
MRLIFPVLFTVGYLISSCSKEEPPLLNDTQIVGDWNWQFHSIGSPTNISTPQTTGITEILSIQEDGSWSKLQNGTIVISGSCWTSIETSTNGSKVNAIHYDIPNNNTDSIAYYSITGNFLTFTNDLMGSVGGGVRVYLKQ